MKSKVLKCGALLMAIVLTMGCLAGCGSEGNKNNGGQSAAGANKGGNTGVKGYYVDEQTGDIIDASTGEVVADGSIQIDEETGNIVDTSTGQTIETKEEAEQIKKEVKKQEKDPSPSKTEKKPENKKEEKEEKKPENKKEDTKVTGNTSKNPSSNKNNSSAASSKYPSSTKKVSFNRERLYNMMAATYKEPNYAKEMTKSEFAHQVKVQIPAKAQKVFDWYLGVMDGGSETQITVTDEEYDLFVSTAKKALNHGITAGYMNNGNGTKTLQTSAAKINEKVDRAYKDYCDAVKKANGPAKKQYEDYLAEVKKDCDLIEKAVNSINIKGKDEVTAINAIIDYICKNCTYGQGSAQGSHTLHAGHAGEWITDCLESHKAVCNGYAKTFYAMCYYAGIDVSYYWGHTNDGEAHAWDSIKINGKEYFFDLTWQDMLQERGSSKETYIWANSSEFGKEHIKDGTDVKFW